MIRASRTIRRAAFTLVELLVVVAAIVVGVAVILPSFTRAIESASYASAINSVTATLGQARSLAMRTGSQTAVAFFFDIEEQVTTLHVLVLDNQFGSLAPTNAVSNPLSASAFVFVPAPNVVPVSLPRGIGVYALSFATDPSSDDAMPPDYPVEEPPFVAWYEGERLRSDIDASVFEPQWIPPRTDPRLFIPEDYDLDDPSDMGDSVAQNAMRFAETFFVRFSADGSALGSVDLGAGASKRNAYLEYPNLPFDPDEPDVPTDAPDEFDPQVIWASGVDPVILNPEVQMRSADLLAVVDFPRMIAETAIRQPWLYRSPESRADASEIVNERETSPTVIAQRVRAISDWIDRNGEVIAFNRFTGNVLRKGTN